ESLQLSSLGITATPENPFTLKITSRTMAQAAGRLTNFSTQVYYTWRLAEVCGAAISGFDPGNFRLDTTGFVNFLGGGVFSLEKDGGYINLKFSPHICAPSDFYGDEHHEAPAWLVLPANPLATPPRPKTLVYIKIENPFGIQNIVGLRLTNCTMIAEAYGSGDALLGTVTSVPDGWMAPGVNDALRQPLPEGTIKVVATATVLSAGQPFSCNAQVQSLCGSSAMAQADPVVTLLEVTGSGVVRQVFDKIPSFERHVSVENREPGLRHLAIVVNGQVFALENLRPGETRRLDIGEAMTSEEDNQIELIGEGEQGAAAQVTIADTPVQIQTTSGPAVYLSLRQAPGGRLQLSWPASAAGWILQGRAAWTGGMDWRAVPGEPEWRDNRWQMELAPESDLQFFRLMQREGQ
ncbi:MAG: hypothetical protein ACKO3N_06945, partial [Verrucomicrobiota bacterium]